MQLIDLSLARTRMVSRCVTVIEHSIAHFPATSRQATAPLDERNGDMQVNVVEFSCHRANASVDQLSSVFICFLVFQT
jgi:hypothetical protein